MSPYRRRGGKVQHVHADGEIPRKSPNMVAAPAQLKLKTDNLSSLKAPLGACVETWNFQMDPEGS